MRSTAFCLLLLLIGSCQPIAGKDYPSLKGLKGVFPQVYVDNELLKRVPALRQDEQARVECLLSEAGIKVLNESDWKRTPAAALMHLDILFTCGRDPGSCGYHVRLNLQQHVHLTADPRTTMEATIWENSYTGSVSNADLPTLADVWLHVDVGALVRDFLNRYREANAKTY